MVQNSNNDERWNRQLEVMWELEKNKNNNEIKEILEELEECKIVKYLKYELDNKDAKVLLDYITNLQEENRQTKLLKERYQLEKEDYKSRIDKAVKYINKYKECEEHSELPCYSSYYKELDKILNGDDE